MVIGPDKVGTEVRLDAIEAAIAKSVEGLIDEKLSLEPKGKSQYSLTIAVKGRLSNNVIAAIKTLYLDNKWKEVTMETAGHTQWDTPDDPYVYSVTLKA
jgi:hypothetical protein